MARASESAQRRTQEGGQEGADNRLPLVRVPGGVGGMANVGKFGDPLGSAGGIIDSPGLGDSGAEVVRPVQEEHRAIQRARIFDRIVGKSVESELPPAPEDHQFGVGERRYAHCPEPVADGAQHGVKYGFQDDGVGPDIKAWMARRMAAAPMLWP